MSAMLSQLLTAANSLALDVPVDPDGDQGAQWIVDELSKPQYQAAQPNLFDIISKQFWDWLNSLELGGEKIPQAPFLVILVLVIAGAIAAAFVIFGVPRLNRRSSAAKTLFGIDETRTSEQLRQAARDAAQRLDWSLAIEELFRSIARQLFERVLVATSPGTTAQEFSQRAGLVFPTFARELIEGSTTFDRVRYLGSTGTETDYLLLVELERGLRAATAPLATGQSQPEPTPIGTRV